MNTEQWLTLILIGPLGFLASWEVGGFRNSIFVHGSSAGSERLKEFNTKLIGVSVPLTIAAAIVAYVVWLKDLFGPHTVALWAATVFGWWLYHTAGWCAAFFLLQGSHLRPSDFEDRKKLGNCDPILSKRALDEMDVVCATRGPLAFQLARWFITAFAVLTASYDISFPRFLRAVEALMKPGAHWFPIANNLAITCLAPILALAIIHVVFEIIRQIKFVKPVLNKLHKQRQRPFD